MSYLIYSGIVVVVAGAVLAFISETFALEVSRGLEAAFERVEYRLALRARERGRPRRDVREVNVTPFRQGEMQPVVIKRSTQQPGVARIAA